MELIALNHGNFHLANTDIREWLDEHFVHRFLTDTKIRVNLFDIINGTYINSCLLSNRKEIVKEVARVFSTVTSSARYIDKPKPYKFNPDGRMDENFEPKKNSFIMFSEGLRLCPGRKLAMIVLVCLMNLYS
ncbi:hypothetical protein C1646_815869 [Rhizophagus diaphanus]|nr:hypothetical protein C1646_815869 [Rhizophagus diaphanus] [Rhizophagus sp. MUCL 43196]